MPETIGEITCWHIKKNQRHAKNSLQQKNIFKRKTFGLKERNDYGNHKQKGKKESVNIQCDQIVVKFFVFHTTRVQKINAAVESKIFWEAHKRNYGSNMELDRDIKAEALAEKAGTFLIDLSLHWKLSLISGNSGDTLPPNWRLKLETTKLEIAPKAPKLVRI